MIDLRLQYWIHLACSTISSLFNLDLLVFGLKFWILDLHLIEFTRFITFRSDCSYWNIYFRSRVLMVLDYNFGFWTVGLFKLGSESWISLTYALSFIFCHCLDPFEDFGGVVDKQHMKGHISKMVEGSKRLFKGMKP